MWSSRRRNFYSPGKSPTGPQSPRIAPSDASEEVDLGTTQFMTTRRPPEYRDAHTIQGSDVHGDARELLKRCVSNTLETKPTSPSPFVHSAR
jgi:hypothetical protein